MSLLHLSRPCRSPTFLRSFQFFPRQRQRCSDWQRYKEEKRGSGRVWEGNRWWWANECYHCLHRPTLANSRLLWLFVHSVLRWPRRWRRRDGHSGKAANSQKADSSLRELASLRAQIWSTQIANFTGGRIAFSKKCFWGWTKLWWYVHGVLFGHREHPGEFCLCLSRVGWTVDGQSQGWSRGRSGRVTPIQAFFGGKDRQLTSMYPQDRQSSNLSGRLDRQSVLLPACRLRSPLDWEISSALVALPKRRHY